METKIYVGNLSEETTESELSELFSHAGKVESVKLMSDPESGQSKGFAIIVMNNEADANNAVQLFNEEAFGDQPIRVILAWHRKGFSSSGYSRGEGRGYRRPGGAYGPERPGGGYGPSRPRRSRPGGGGKDTK